MSELVVIAINGVALAGKDTFARKVLDQHGLHGICISTIDPIKGVYADFFGWGGLKTAEHRKNLNTLKTVWKQCSNGPINWVRREIFHAKGRGKNVVFIMVREFDEMVEIISVAKSMGCISFSLCIERDGLEIPPIEQEFLDSIPDDYVWDVVVFNKTVSTFPDTPELDEKAKVFSETLLNLMKGR